MKPISGMDYDAARPSVLISGERGPQKIQRPEDGSKECRPKPVMDEYVPEEEEEPSGGYWLGKDDEGRPKICTVSTDKVDREIKELKEQKQKLEQRLSIETDETEIEDLEGELAQVERELSQKDNDTYRRQHASYTFSS